ncbi:MAG: type 1 glutamine amidotransferase [Spirochaetaceae bacterium]
MSDSREPTALRIHVFQHVPFEGPAFVGEWLSSRGHSIATTRFFNQETAAPLPRVDDYDWLVVMGGPMSANDTDRLPWLRAERECIRDAISAGRTVLGICLGAQLIAAALGAGVYPNYYREIGWFPVSIEHHSPLFSQFPASIPALHWHAETFSLPPGAELLARSDGCVNQAFSVGDRVLGLQFHLEATRASAEELVEAAAGDLSGDGPYVASREEILDEAAPFGRSNRYMETILAGLERVTRPDSAAARDPASAP